MPCSVRIHRPVKAGCPVPGEMQQLAAWLKAPGLDTENSFWRSPSKTKTGSVRSHLMVLLLCCCCYRHYCYGYYYCYGCYRCCCCYFRFYLSHYCFRTDCYCYDDCHDDDDTTKTATPAASLQQQQLFDFCSVIVIVIIIVTVPS